MGEKRILIVDDDSDFMRIMGAHLEVHGYNVVSASNGTEALKAVQTERPDLIVLDVSMPGGDGLTVLKRLRASEHNDLIPVIIVTGLAPEAKAEAFAAGAAAFYLKPVDIDNMVECIREELGQPVEAGRRW